MLNVAEPEALVTRWLNEKDDAQAHETLSSLIELHAEPTVRRIVSYKLTGGASYRDRARAVADLDDVCNETLRRLLTHLAGLKSGTQRGPVKNFGSYVAVTAFNACNEYFRQKSPARYRLSNKLRYLLTHSRLFALWETSNGLEACGLADMAGQQPKTDFADLAFVQESRFKTVGPAVVDVVMALLQAAGSALLFEVLIRAFAQCTGMQEVETPLREREAEGSARPWESLPAGEPSADRELATRQYIDKLWSEIRELPLEQRRALLLNLRDSAGGDIQLFDWLGIATVRQIAAALEMDPLLFAELWKELPLDDARIASQLGMSRQDVINRRSSARIRLAKKMKQYEGLK